jgi:hypothetical protein
MPPKKIKITKKPWTTQHVTKYNWLFNWFSKENENVNKESFIDENKRKLLSLIEKNESWADGSKEGLMFMVSRYLYNKNNKDRYVKLYSEAGFNLLKKKEEKEQKNELDEKEKENHRNIEYLQNILELHKENENENITEHYKHLFLMMLIYQPPLRTSFYSSAKFLRLLTKNNKETNYIYITRKGKLKIYYIVNKDKATNYKLYSVNKSLSKIKIENDQLIHFINESFIKYPRTYLFELNKKPVSDATLLKWLRDITQTPLINIDMIRSAYITRFYEDNKTYGKRDKLSRDMRHSQATASKNYLKVTNEPVIPPDELIKTLNIEILKLKTEIQELNIKLTVYEGNDELDKKFKKKRGDILFLLNNRNHTAKTETIKKYDILYDETKKSYY